MAIGNADLMSAQGIDSADLNRLADPLSAKGHSMFFAAFDGALGAMISVADPLRKDAATMITALKKRGLGVAMVTGDGQGTADAVRRNWALRQ